MTLQSLDTALLLFVNHGTANPFFDDLMPFFSARGYLLVIPFLLYLVVLAATKQNDRGKNYLIAAVAAFVISCFAVYLADWAEHMLKELIARPRPCRAVEGIRLIVACPKSFSMPSGHAISSFAFATPLFYLSRAYVQLLARLYPIVLASLIAFSRNYLGVHYPTDVLVGTLLGALIAMTLSVLYEAAVKRMRRG